MNFIIFVLFLMSLFLGYKINEKKQFIPLPPINTWLPYESWFHSKDALVSSNNEYYHLVENYYSNGSTSCYSLFDGIVIEKDENSITVLHDNGVRAKYGELEHIIVNVDDRVLKGNSMATIQDTLTIIFTKDNQNLSYEEVMKL